MGLGTGQKDRKKTRAERYQEGKGAGIWKGLEKEAAGKEEDKQKDGEGDGDVKAAERKKNKGWRQDRDWGKNPGVGSKMERE